MIRTRKSSWAALALAAALSSLAAGCEENAYCFNCEGPKDQGSGGKVSNVGGSAGSGQGGGISFSGNGGAAGGCGDTESDPKNCGTCGNVCKLAGALPRCVAGKCVAECSIGFVDLDKKADNGCEYACTVSNGGVEICDGKDNDCDGKVDDVAPEQLQGDVNHCGKCGNACALASAVPTCVQGACAISECLPGLTDLDKKVENGCEYACGKTNGGVEICDGKDNDCDGQIDDDPDTSSDPFNCGKCGETCVGKFANSDPQCQGGQCVLGPCAGGFIDKDGDPSNGCEFNCTSLCSFPFAVPKCNVQGDCSMGDCLLNHHDLNSDPTDGCEYACTVSNGGVEICDGKDNDCDGQIDEGAETSSDPFNCGKCGETCAGKFANSDPQCQGGQCVLGPCIAGYSDKDGDPSNGCEYSCQSSCGFPFATVTCGADGSCQFGQCLIGHYDLNNDPSDGCEYACQFTGNSELCDAKDNDCDGQIDESFDLSSDPENCGQCGTQCAAFFPNSTVACQVQGGAPTCVFTGCKPGFSDDDGNPANGCEYACTVTNNGVEACDGVDNDCDGVADNPPGGVFNPPLPEQCPPDDPQSACQSQTRCQAGAPTCVQITGPTDEVCDGKDNDCDGQVDEGPLPQIGVPCGQSQVGECAFGTTACQNGAVVCQGEVTPQPEACDGKDNDCNGKVDDSAIGVGQGCGDSTGACSPGAQQCVGGKLVCVGAVGPSAEVCEGPNASGDAFDNDCDGQIDEGCTYPKTNPVRLDTNGSAVGQHSSHQIAGASAGDDFLVVYADRRSGNGDIYGRVSTSAGSSWGNNDFIIANEGNVEVEPYPFLRVGRAYLAYSRFEGGIRRIYVRASSSPYTAWTAGTKIDPNAANNGQIDCYDPQGVVARAGATAAEDHIAVLWSEIAGSQANPTRNIYLRYSKDGGATFSATLNVNSGAGQNKGELPVIATNGQGVVFVAWRDKRTAGLAQAYVSRIDLNLASPSLSTPVALQPTSLATAANAEQIVIAADGNNNVHVGWADLRPPTKTIRVATSNDGGFSWTQVGGVNDGVIVNADSTFADAASPALAALDGRVLAAWEDTRSGAPDIRVNHSSDGGKTWQPTSARADTGDGLGQSVALFPRVAFGVGTTAYVTWQDLRFPASAVLANVSIDLGETFHASASAAYRMDIDTPVNPAGGSGAGSQFPFLLASPTTNRASVVWIDFRDGNGNNGQNGDIWTRLLE